MVSVDESSNLRASPPEELLVILQATSRATNLTLTQDGLHLVSIDATVRSWKSVLCCQAPKPAHSQHPYLHILNATLQQVGEQLIVEIKALGKHGRDGVVTIRGAVEQESVLLAERWVHELLYRAYGDTRRNKRLKVLVNPVGGPGRAKALWIKTVEPIFRSAGCILDVTYTTHSGHGREIAEGLKLDEQDSLVVFSGDGLIYEVINGLCKRRDALLALKRCPLGILPGGSGNAASISINGPSKGVDPTLAALTVLKGQPMKIDLCTITQGKERYYSFLSQAYGVMADVDLGTEHMRWMGSTRFTVGFIQRALAGPRYDCEISMRIIESDKSKMRADALSKYAASKRASMLTTTSTSSRPSNPFIGKDEYEHEDALDIESAGHDLSMPPLKFGTILDAIPSGSGPDIEPIEGSRATGWTTINSPISSVYAGQMPYMADSLLMFPIANNDGSIVLSVLPVVKAMTLLGAMDGAEVGKIYENENEEYYKVEAYRLYPKPSTNGLPNYLSIDGESVPYEPFQVEVHPGIGRMLSLTGHWYLPEEWTKGV